MEQEPVNLFEFEDIACKKLSAMAYDYYSSGACDEITLRENHAAYDMIFLKYRVLRDVSKRDLSCSVLGQKISYPVIIAPTAFHGLAHPDAEIATVKAAGNCDIIMMLSTLSNTAVEDVVRNASGPVWFQLYVYKDRETSKDLIHRVEEAGCKAIVLTVDAPVIGLRERDVKNVFKLPDSLKVQNMNAYGSGVVGSSGHNSGLAEYFDSLLDASLTWKDIGWLKSITSLPVIIKGIGCAEDAKLAVENGADGIVVSNHGGRQLDTCRATINVLPEAAEVVDNRIEILIDGGVRRGTDVIKAIALGAKAVCIGRPVLWGLAVNGQKGVELVLNILKKEIDLAMALCGANNVQNLNKDLIDTKNLRR